MSSMVSADDKINQLIIDMPTVKNFNDAVAFSTGDNLGEYYKRKKIDNLIEDIKKQHKKIVDRIEEQHKEIVDRIEKQHKKIVDRISLEMPPIEQQHREEPDEYYKRLHKEFTDPDRRQFKIVSKITGLKSSGKTKKQKRILKKRKLKKQKSKRKKKY